jgi:signal transduction histidine kinase
MADALLQSVLSRLDLVLIDCSDEAQLQASPPTPMWFDRLGLLARSAENPAELRSPFVAHFLVDAREYWGRAERGEAGLQPRLRSGICVEQGEDGQDYSYELSALLIDGRRLLLCELDPSPERGQFILQGARTSRYEYESLERAQRALLESQEALRQAKDRAEQTSADKSLFLAQVSHELRVPLHSILGYTALAESHQPLPPGVAEPLLAIRASAGALQALIEDLLDLSRIEAGRLVLERDSFAPAEVLREALRIVAPLADSKGLPVRSDLAAIDSLQLCGDAARLRQVVLNLLNNAIKFTARGSVEVRASLQPPGPGAAPDSIALRVEIQDSGIGIAPEHHERLFRPFSQAERAISRQFGGTGLGLAIAKRLVEAMAGEIGFSSQPGHGSCFWFVVRMPAVATPTVAAGSGGSGPALGALAGPAIAPAPSHLRVLVAEDNPINRTLAVHMLGRLGLEVSTVPDGRQAVDAVTRQDFDLVLMDRYMPELDGPDACREIRTLPPPRGRVPIIATSADLRPSERDAMHAAGLDDCLGKPFTLAELAAVLARFLPRAQPPVSSSQKVE